MLSRTNQPVLSPPPAIDRSRHSLFVDFDGTLVPLVDHPDLVRADTELLDLLAALAIRFPGRLALVSGRSIEQLDRMIGPITQRIAVAGSHGAEVRRDGQLVQPPRPEGLDAAIVEVRAYGAGHPEMIIEEKSHGQYCSRGCAVVAQALHRCAGRRGAVGGMSRRAMRAPISAKSDSLCEDPST